MRNWAARISEAQAIRHVTPKFIVHQTDTIWAIDSPYKGNSKNSKKHK